MRRAMRLAAVVAGVLGAFAISGAAFADPPGGQVNGQGQTPLSASLGFNAQADLSGSLEYNADPQGPDAGFSVHCNDYTSYALVYSKSGTPKVLVTASNCFDQDGTQIYMKGSFSDRGEPGVRDSLCVAFSYTFPVDPKNAAVHDMGLISGDYVLDARHVLLYSHRMDTHSGGLDLLTCRSAARSASSLSLSRTFFGNNFFMASSVVNSLARFFRLGMEVS